MAWVNIVAIAMLIPTCGLDCWKLGNGQYFRIRDRSFGASKLNTKISNRTQAFPPQSHREDCVNIDGEIGKRPRWSVFL